MTIIIFLLKEVVRSLKKSYWYHVKPNAPWLTNQQLNWLHQTYLMWSGVKQHAVKE